MRPFSYARALDIDDATAGAIAFGQARYIGGGTNLLDLMKFGIEELRRLIDINRLPLGEVEKREGRLRIGALVTNADLADHPIAYRALEYEGRAPDRRSRDQPSRANHWHGAVSDRRISLGARSSRVWSFRSSP